MQHFAQHIRVVASTWSRILVLIWKTNPWYVTWLLVFTFLGGLIPSLQIQITSQIIQNAAEAIQGGHAPQLVHLAILFGLLQGGLMLVSSVLGIGHQNNLFVSSLFEFLDVAPSNIANGKRAVPERLQRGIELRGVSFCYPGTTEMVLQDLNLFLKAGECVALVGHNGAGKTTLVKLLTRLYEPTTGKILLDDVPLEEFDIFDVRRHISVIFQDFVHYEMAARVNVG